MVAVPVSMLECQHPFVSPFFSRPFGPPATTLSTSVSTSLRSEIHKPASYSYCVSALPRCKIAQSCLAQLPKPAAALDQPEAGDGPIELPPSAPSVFTTVDSNSPLQTASSILVTGAISVFLFRALRRRAKRARELKFRSSGVKPTSEESLERSKVTPSPSPEVRSPPSPAQALLGGLMAGIIALFLYKFTTTIEASLNRQTISDSFSVRQITITIRTIVNGLCYLATFLSGFTSIGLFLYSGQLAMKSLTSGSTDEDDE